MPMIDIAAFRAAFPEFSDTLRYPDSLISYWATLAEALLNVCVWGDLKPFAVNLYVAHEITLAQSSSSGAGYGGTPSGPGGPVQSKTVAQASISYDTQQTAEAGAGWWNLTNYGKELYRLMMMFGAGAIQL